jgi:transposase/DNA-binding CsgD family transcriptional regulator
VKRPAQVTRPREKFDPLVGQTRFEHRVEALSLLQRGMSAANVARDFGVSPASIRRWFRKFKNGGTDALGRTSRGGRPRKLSPDMVQRLAGDLKRNPASLGYTQIAWSGTLVCRHLWKSYSIRMSPRHALRIIREFGVSTPANRGHRNCLVGNSSSSPPDLTSERRSRPTWDGLNKEIALRRIKRLASSGLALEPFVLTLFDLIETAVPGGTRKALIADPGDRPDAFIVNYDPQFLAEIVPAFQRFMVDASPEESGMRVKFDTYSLKHAFLAKTVWPLEELMLPHYYRSAGYNEVIRRLNQRHGAWIVYKEHGQTTGFYPFWRDPDQRLLSRDDLAFLGISAPHIAHGLRTAQLLSRRPAEVSSTSFVPIGSWGSGIILMDSEGRVIAADERARALFGHLERFDAELSAGLGTIRQCDALQYIAHVLNRVFSKDGETEAASAVPVVRLFSHWSGVVLRLRGVLTPGAEGKNYFTVIVEQGELEDHRRSRLRYRWGLSAREFEILALLGNGRMFTEMAQLMNLQRDTLKSYMRRLVDKFDLPDFAALRAFARQEPPDSHS